MPSNYQAAIWSRSLLALPQTSPTWTWLEGERKQHFHRLDENVFWSVLAVSAKVAQKSWIKMHAIVITLRVPVPVGVNIHVITR